MQRMDLAHGGLHCMKSLWSYSGDSHGFSFLRSFTNGNNPVSLFVTLNYKILSLFVFLFVCLLSFFNIPILACIMHPCFKIQRA